MSLPEPASNQMEGMLEFNKHILFLVLLIISLVGWLLFSVISNFEMFNSSANSQFYHSNALEIAWTTLPALSLLKIAFPSFAILYSMDEDKSNGLRIVLKVLGNQWFWAYELNYVTLPYRLQEFFSVLLPPKKSLRFTSYMLSQESIDKLGCAGLFRLLETNKRVVLPVNISVRFLVTSLDVLHSWSLPSFGLKVDACPGRLNKATLTLTRVGLFFGQCSEICGVNHGFMPIVVMVTDLSVFEDYLERSGMLPTIQDTAEALTQFMRKCARENEI